MILKTKRLILRPPKKSDWKDVVEGVNNLNVSKMISTIPHPYSKKDASGWINQSAKENKKKENKSHHFMIELKSEKKVIGCTSITSVYRFVNKAHAGSWINEDYWRNGYILEAKIAVFDFAFNILNLNKIETDVFAENKASNGMQKKLGFRFVGTLKESSRSMANKKLHDVNVWELMKSDWLKVRPKLIKEVELKIRESKNDKKSR